MQGMQVQSLSWENALEREMATHPSILVWAIPWTEEPDRLQSMVSQESDMTEQLDNNNNVEMNSLGNILQVFFQ